MKLLLCPSATPEFRRLAQFAPLATVPFLGESLVEYWLAHLVLSGASEVRILASDRPEVIAGIVGTGERWGIRAEVVAESRELSPDEAQLKYGDNRTVSEIPGGHIEVLDHFPGASASLFDSYGSLFAGILDWMPRARMEDRVGVKELKPGVWIGTQARVSPQAKLQAPCWIGNHVYVGPQAVIGPQAVVEDRAFIEPGVEVSSSVIGPDTFVGRLAEIEDSFAWGSMLINWQTGSAAEVPDAFLLSALRQPLAAQRREGILARWARRYLNSGRSGELIEPFSEKQRGVA